MTNEPKKEFTPEEKAKGRRATLILNIVMVVFIAAPFVTWWAVKKAPTQESTAKNDAPIVSFHRAQCVYPGMENPIPPEGYQLRYQSVRVKTGQGEQTIKVPYFVQTQATLTDEMMTDAQAVKGFSNDPAKDRWEVSFTWTPQGQEIFTRMTREIVEENEPSGNMGCIAIVLRGELMSVPRVAKTITGDKCAITGNLSQTEMEQLAADLNASKK